MIPNQLMQSSQQQQPMMGQQLAPQQQPQVSPTQIQDFHTRLSDFQDHLKKTLELPDQDLNMSKIYDLATDLIAKNADSNGKNGATAIEVAKELSSPDFPPMGQNGEDPLAPAIRKFLLNHFNRMTSMQAALTRRYGAPQQAPTQQPQPIAQQ